MNDTRELLVALRGGESSQCDYCGRTFLVPLNPDEANTWSCNRCLSKEMGWPWSEGDEKAWLASIAAESTGV